MPRTNSYRALMGAANVVFGRTPLTKARGVIMAADGSGLLGTVLGVLLPKPPEPPKKLPARRKPRKKS